MTKECRKSRFLERVLTVISNLGALRGSSARDILNYLLSSCADKSSSRNLTLQLQQALKEAVIAGLLKLQGGRYKICSKSADAPPKLKSDEEEKSKLPPRQKTKKKKKRKKRKGKHSSRRTSEKRGGNSEASGAEKRAGNDDSRSNGHQSKSEKNPSAE
ncbi:uncharacterized protein LOC103316131 [Nasonia vitripennis]|uniref:H15 domain-containing protein n=1 Tax=Nasonia vitripennis TaxID=7425 RepID=A0A7M7QVC8_NASVI|nr:uncharacterized protein LOC103316131 [Nasonia vitripennis]XP_032454171.1 uncharacterized protein LOC103316131 [Nasonia vitripennis]XP_032454172.1 uncharacterized protein LOC103316131 [Nasonia vitripennis]XP_032454173.1 uncharacterized protein LOC103316131 [Nasonia vitripennis]